MASVYEDAPFKTEKTKNGFGWDRSVIRVAFGCDCTRRLYRVYCHYEFGIMRNFKEYCGSNFLEKQTSLVLSLFIETDVRIISSCFVCKICNWICPPGYRGNVLPYLYYFLLPLNTFLSFPFQVDALITIAYLIYDVYINIFPIPFNIVCAVHLLSFQPLEVVASLCLIYCHTKRASRTRRKFETAYAWIFSNLPISVGNLALLVLSWIHLDITEPYDITRTFVLVFVVWKIPVFLLINIGLALTYVDVKKKKQKSHKVMTFSTCFLIDRPRYSTVTPFSYGKHLAIGTP